MGAPWPKRTFTATGEMLLTPTERVRAQAEARHRAEQRAADAEATIERMFQALEQLRKRQSS